MPKLIVYSCDEPGCSKFVKIDAIKSANISGKVPIPEDWYLENCLNSSGDHAVKCPEHNLHLEVQREWRETQAILEEAFDKELQKNPPKGGLIDEKTPSHKPLLNHFIHSGYLK